MSKSMFEIRYGLSGDAARLLEWIESRKPDDQLASIISALETEGNDLAEVPKGSDH